MLYGVNVTLVEPFLTELIGVTISNKTTNDKIAIADDTIVETKRFVLNPSNSGLKRSNKSDERIKAKPAIAKPNPQPNSIVRTVLIDPEYKKDV